MDFKTIARSLWIVILTLFMLYLDSDSANLRAFAENNSVINVYVITCLVFYIICHLFSLGILCLLISGFILMINIFVTLLQEGEYACIWIVLFAIIGLMSNERCNVLFMKVFYVTLNFVLLLDIVIFVTLKDRV